MTAEERFLSEGAEYFGNRLIWKRRDVGVKTPGGSFATTPDGDDAIAELEAITDVESRPVEEAPVGRQRKADATSLDEVLKA